MHPYLMSDRPGWNGLSTGRESFRGVDDQIRCSAGCPAKYSVGKGLSLGISCQGHVRVNYVSAEDSEHVLSYIYSS